MHMAQQIGLPFWYQLTRVVPDKRSFNRCVLSGTTRTGQYQKIHSPTYTHPDQQTSFISFLHLLRSTASSLFNLRA